MSDWLPTLLDAVKPSLDEENRKRLESLDLGDIDGVSQWPILTDPRAPDPRRVMLYNIDPGSEGGENAALRVGEMKLILGKPGQPDGWIPPPHVTDSGDRLYPDDQQRTCTTGNYDATTIRLFNLTGDEYPLKESFLLYQYLNKKLFYR